MYLTVEGSKIHKLIIELFSAYNHFLQKLNLFILFSGSLGIIITFIITFIQCLPFYHNKLWKILKEMGIPGHFTWLLRNLYTGQEATVRTNVEQRPGSKLGKEYIKTIYCCSAYLAYVQSTSCKMLGWMNHKLKSRFPEEISTTSDMQMIPFQWQKMKVKVAQSCLALCDPMDYAGHGILQARILEWVAFPFFRGSSQTRDQIQVSHIGGRFFTS